MSEIKLNLIDSQTILSGTIHGSIGDRCVAALSAEPETISELEAALARFERCPPNFSVSPNFNSRPSVDPAPYDAGILIIDLAARIVACDSTYSQPGREGSVEYHDGVECTDLSLRYRLPDDWLFVNSTEEYEGLYDERRQARATPPLDARAILYGPALLDFIATNVKQSPQLQNCGSAAFNRPRVEDTQPAGPSLTPEHSNEESDDDCHPLAETVRDIHRRWLLTPRADLHGQSPRELLLAKQDLIDFDLESRIMQWSFQLEGPPCLDRNSFAYRFAGFGTHEWVIYYYMVRHLIWKAVDMRTAALESTSALESNSSALGRSSSQPQNQLIISLDEVKSSWLNEPNADFEDRAPINIIDNERKRLPEALGGRSMVVDENCPICKMMGDEAEAGLGIYFWHLDGCNMDDEFAFSTFRTIEEWEKDHREMEERHKDFDRRWKEREERIARGEMLESDPLFDPPELDEIVPWRVSEPDPPEA
jgi:hypothetical protein